MLLFMAFPLRQEFVEFVLTEDRTQRGLGKLTDGLHVVLDVEHGVVGVDHPEVQNGVDLHRHVVPRDQILRRHVHDDRTQVDADHLLQQRDDDDQPRPP